MDKIESDCISVIFRINYYDLMIMCALFQNYKALQFDNNKDKRKISFSQVNNSAKKKHLELEKKEENSPVVSKENNFKELVQSNVHKIKATQEKESKSNYCSFNFIEPTQALVRDESSDDTDDDDDDAPAATAGKKEVKFCLLLIFLKLNLKLKGKTIAC